MPDLFESLKALIDSTPACAAMFDTEMRYLACSQRWLRDYQLSPREVPGLSHYELFPKISAEWKAVHQRCLAGATETGNDYPFPQSDDCTRSTKWSVHPWRTERGEIGGLIMFTERVIDPQRAQTGLDDADRHFRALTEDLTIGAYSIRDGKVVYANRVLASAFGYSMDEIVGTDPLMLADPRDRAMIVEHLQRRLQGQTVHVHYEFRAICRDGGTKLMEVYGTVVDMAGHPTIMGNMVDITARRQAEEALRSSEEKFETVFRSSPIPMTLNDSDRGGVFIDVNEAFESMMGYHRDEVIGRTPQDLGIWADPSRRKEALLQFRSHGKIRDFEHQYRRKNGDVGTGLLSIEPISIGIRRCSIVTVTDVTERRRAEQALRESENKFRAVVENSRDRILFLDAKGRILYRSPKNPRMSGYGQEEPAEHNWFDSIYPEDLAGVLRHWEEAIGNPSRVQDFQYRVPDKDGGWRWMDAVAQNLLGNPDVQAVVVNARDITRRKHAEAKLLEREERFRAIFDQTFEFIGILRTDGTVMEANRSALQFIGLSEQQVLDRPFWEVAQWSYSQEVQNKLREAIEAAALGRFAQLEVTHPGPDGTLHTFDISIKPVRDEQGRVALLIPEGRDITERKLAEEARETAERQYQEIFEGAVEGFFRTSPEGRNLSANPALVRMLGYSSAEELVGTITDSAHQVWLNPVERAKYVQVLEERGVVRGYECQCKRKDGTTLWVSLNSRKVCGPDGSTLYHEGFIEDISARKHAEAEREKLWGQLAQAQKMESIGRLAGGIAHDFNNLLSVINGHSSLALSRLPEGDPLRSRMEEILKAGERAAGLTQQLLAFSRKQVLEPRVFDLNDGVSEMRSMLEHLMGDDVDVGFDLHRGPIPVFADSHQLGQVIMNLAVNARDAMPAGGCLRVETGIIDGDDVPITTGLDAPGGRYAVLAVEDTGVGMDEATRQRIFEPFFTTKGAGIGTGLGLSMVQGIVAQSGGYIDVDTAPGRGTAFKIYLPLQEGATANSEAPAAVPALMGEETVLLVEDRAEVRDYAAEVLRDYGYRVIEAANADEALARCQRESARIHLVLADVMMPGTSGVDLVARLSKIQPGIKSLFMSGYSEDVVRDRVLLEGSRFIQKPFTPDELADKVRTVLLL
jgi:PAS domain S-box-containing protein